MSLEGKLIGKTDLPLQTEVFSLVDNLPQSIIDRIMQTVSWKNRSSWELQPTYEHQPDIFLTGTRSISSSFTQEEARFFSGRYLTDPAGFQLKGLVYVPSELLGNVRSIHLDKIMPPSSDVFEEHGVMIMDVDEIGYFVSKNQRARSPRGAIPIRKLEATIEITQRGLSKGLIAPVPIGYGIFPNLLFDNAPTGFLILSIYDSWNARMLDFFRSVPYLNSNLKEQGILHAPHPSVVEYLGSDRNTFATAEMTEINRLAAEVNGKCHGIIMDLFESYGAGLAKAHKAGIVFFNPHLDNVLPTRKGLALYDWEHAKDVTDEQIIRRAGYCCLDMRNAFNQAMHFIEGAKMTGYHALVGITQVVNPFSLMLHGYGISRFQANVIGSRALMELENEKVAASLRGDILPHVFRMLKE